MNIVPLAELPEAALEAIGAGDAVGAIAFPTGHAPEGISADVRAAGMMICDRLAVIDDIEYWGVDLTEETKRLLSEEIEQGPPPGLNAVEVGG